MEKMEKKLKRLLPAALTCLMILSWCTSCSDMKGYETAQRTGFFFDTAISIKLTAKDPERLLDDAMEMCEGYEDIFSSKKEGSELYRLNHRNNDSVEVSDELADIIETGLYYNRISNGAFSMTAAPLSELWNVKGGRTQVPEQNEISDALAKVDDGKIHIDGNVVSFDSPDTRIDLGGIAKGYVSDRLKEYFEQQGCTSACINLGGNVCLAGRRDDGKMWKVGLQKPFADRGDLLTTIEAENECVISAGIYERYFISDGTIYHHIMDPFTGYPADSGLNMVTVIGNNGTEADALSTIGIVLGQEETEKLIRNNGIDVEIIFTDSENNMSFYPESFKDGKDK